MGDEVKSTDIALKVQKKFLSTMASTSLTKLVIDDKTGDILDEFHNIRKQQTGNKKDAEKLLKNIVKVMVKVAVLEKNNRFSDADKKLADKLQQVTKMAGMTIISFYEVDFTFDKYVLSKQINEGRTLLQQIIATHLSEKSKSRVNSVFDVLGDPDFLEELFDPNSKYRPSLKIIANRISELIKEGVL